MPSTEVRAWAKLNLTLDVLGQRADGYHDLRMVMQSVSLCDTLRLEFGTEGATVRVRSSLSFLPEDGNNLAALAALCYWRATGRPPEELIITLDKRIPVCAGMAGGSSDAAAVLRALNRHYGDGLSREQLAAIGAEVGSDVPYCVWGGTALAEGRGERLTRLPAMPECTVVLCKPPFPISTPELFRQIDGARLRCRPDTRGMIEALGQGSLPGVAQRLYNVFEDVLPPRKREKILEIKDTLLECGALGACMSGTGPTVFGLFSERARGEAAYRRLKEQYAETYLADTALPEFW